MAASPPCSADESVAVLHPPPLAAKTSPLPSSSWAQAPHLSHQRRAEPSIHRARAELASAASGAGAEVAHAPSGVAGPSASSGPEELAHAAHAARAEDHPCGSLRSSGTQSPRRSSPSQPAALWQSFPSVLCSAHTTARCGARAHAPLSWHSRASTSRQLGVASISPISTSPYLRRGWMLAGMKMRLPSISSKSSSPKINWSDPNNELYWYCNNAPGEETCTVLHLQGKVATAQTILRVCNIKTLPGAVDKTFKV